MTIDEAIETLRYEIDEECHCDYIANEIRLLIAEIEEKRLKLTETRLEIKRQKAEIERLQKEKDILIKTYSKCQIATLKEFAERLKGEAFKIDYCGSIYNVVDVDDIDKVKKEMAGEG